MTITTPLPMLVDEVEVVAVQRLSPSFVRIELGGQALADFGVDGPLYDLRIKLVFPPESGVMPSVEGAEESWFATWLERPVEERGHMRTYTVRAVRGHGADTRLVVDFVLHLADGATGPGSSWASTARPGDRLITVAPRRGVAYGGVEFVPGTARCLLLAGDETAVPAICSILECLPERSRGAAFLEVPHAGDVLDVDNPGGVEVVWLPREGAPLGERLHAAVAAHLGAVADPSDEITDDDLDPDLWETPTYSSSGEPLPPEPVAGPHADLYAWVAGESKVVTGVRRHLVDGLGVDRRQVAFMGYWRRGVAMRS